MKKHKHFRFGIIGLALRISTVILFVVIFAFEAYIINVQKEGDSSLPPLFGNFSSNRAILEKEQDMKDFAFAVVGDTRSIGTFELITSELRKRPLNFAVLLGDCSYGGTEDHHKYFRAECAEEYTMPFPIFYVVGNHDVSPNGFPIKRFEEVYGPSIFSFEYRKCLFIVLRILDPPFTNEESLTFLAKFRNVDLGKYLHTFAFIHIPPPVSPTFKVRNFGESEDLVALFNELGIEYVLAGDFHGYARSRQGKTNYIVTGGGGAPLKKRPRGQFHHATIIYVTPDSVDEQILAVPLAKDFEDQIEKVAIIDVWPWMKRNIALVIGLNMLALLGFVLSASSLIQHVLGLIFRYHNPESV